MTSPIGSTSSTSSAQYTSGIESSPRPGPTMNAAALQKWLEAQVGEMWDKVSDATNGVDQRNKSQEALTVLARKASNNEPITAADIKNVTDGMPAGPTRDAVLALAPTDASPEEVAAAQAKVDAANAEITKCDDAQIAFNASIDSITVGNEKKQEAINERRGKAKEVLVGAQRELKDALETHTVTGGNVAEGLKGAASALDKQNTLAMTELQYQASTAQQAMSLVGNILKIQGDSAKETIGRIS